MLGVKLSACQETIEVAGSGNHMVKSPHVRERRIRGDERLRSRLEGGRSEDGVERSEAGVPFEQAQSGQQMDLLDGEERGQQLGERAGQLGGIPPPAPAGPNVGELLDDLGGGGGLDGAGGDGFEQRPAWELERVVGALGVDQDRGVQDDQPCRPRMSSSSRLRSAGSGTGMSGAARTRPSARVFRS